MKIAGIPLVLLLLALSVSGAPEQKLMSVQVKSGELRAAPSFLGAVVASAAYGDRVAVLASQGVWTQVQTLTSGAQGWIHTSALTPKRIVLTAGAGDVEAAASGGELALAGKGFNSDVEASFKTRDPAADFASVDRMEKMRVSQVEIQAFLAQGGLVPPQGGAR